MSSEAAVHLWGRRIGGVLDEPGATAAVFQYDAEFAASGIEVAPLAMPLRTAPYTFPALNPETFHGLPGLLADSLPDRYGSSVMDTWLEAQGRDPADAGTVERLCYVGARGMGALEFVPALAEPGSAADAIQLDALVELASEVLTERAKLVASLKRGEEREAMRQMLSVGTSAGGARAKAVIAWNPRTGELRSGQIDAGPGFEYWLLKFDGVKDGRTPGEAEGYGLIELAYARMAAAAGVEMMPCRVWSEGGRNHFMTKRFDRVEGDDKLHMQSLGALLHIDYNEPLSHSYEQAFAAMRRLELRTAELEQQFRRMVFNVVARNQDDHVKNVAFLMDRAGAWSLSPAYDVTYAYQPDNRWTRVHQMSLNGKRDGFTLADLEAVARNAALKRGTAERVFEEVRAAVLTWPELAAEAGVPESRAESIRRAQRLELQAS
ncbi:MAG TPA: type II toxin-antitoxin system HipA family toxin [Solirubrobacterales bacterium]|nr:type II toxin-antitoxin system HipA family toxin [Solirubrobacterales bacterium]